MHIIRSREKIFKCPDKDKQTNPSLSEIKTPFSVVDRTSRPEKDIKVINSTINNVQYNDHIEHYIQKIKHSFQPTWNIYRNQPGCHDSLYKFQSIINVQAILFDYNAINFEISNKNFLEKF